MVGLLKSEPIFLNLIFLKIDKYIEMCYNNKNGIVSEVRSVFIVILKDLFFKVNIKEVLDYLHKTYEDEIQLDDKYTEVFNKLRKMPPVKDKDLLELFVVEQKEYFEYGVNYIAVYGIDRVENEHYALDFVPWGKWLGLPIVEKSLKKYGAVCFVAECLHEMTCISFDEAKIQEEEEELNRRIASIEKVEKGMEKSYTIDEVIAHLNEEFDFGFTVVERTLEEKEEDKQRYKEVAKFNQEKMDEVLK